ncbi:trihelix transcription factor GT-4 [Ixodes scapularis]|uniref:trihelix transcription factor GT-4 n=1 Tax=Ixodes scapularis TaxID=6945 RepID=UPI001A9F70CB|nr:trihelix transcription factor GT-4 [Ixodes scapularis]
MSQGMEHVFYMIDGTEYAFLPSDEHLQCAEVDEENAPEDLQLGEQQPSEEPGPGAWRREETLALIVAYTTHKVDFNNPKKKKKHVWREISEELAEKGIQRTAEECETKWKGLKRTYVKRKQEKRASGRGRRDWEFFDAMDEALRESRDFTAPFITLPPAPTPVPSIVDSGASTSAAVQPPPAPVPVPVSRGNTQGEAGGDNENKQKRRRPVTMLSEMLQKMEEWEIEDRRRYNQQLKMQRLKLKLLKRLVNSQHGSSQQ